MPDILRPYRVADLTTIVIRRNDSDGGLDFYEAGDRIDLTDAAAATFTAGKCEPPIIPFYH